MAIKIDWAEFRDHFATLKAWIREWDNLFVFAKPPSDADADARQAYFRNEDKIKKLRAHIRSACEACEALLVEAGATEEKFGVKSPKDFYAALPFEHKPMARAICSGYRAIYEAEWLVRKSKRATNYTYYSWELLHAHKEMRKSFIACREAIGSACWVLLDHIEDLSERTRTAQENADDLEVDLPAVDSPPSGGEKKRADSPTLQQIKALKELRERDIPRSQIPAEFRKHYGHLVPANKRSSWPSEETQLRWERKID